MADEVMRLLEAGDRNGLEAQLSDGSSFQVLVDWREEDDYIVHYFNMALPDERLGASWSGAGLEVTYDGARYFVPLTMSPDDRLLTVRAVQSIIAPRYTVKLISTSLLTDGSVYYVRPTSWWTEAERVNRDLLAQVFEDVPTDARAADPVEAGMSADGKGVAATYTPAAEEAPSLLLRRPDPPEADEPG